MRVDLDAVEELDEITLDYYTWANSPEAKRDAWEHDEQRRQLAMRVVLDSLLGRPSKIVWKNAYQGWRGFFYKVKVLVCLLTERQGYKNHMDIELCAIEHGTCYGGWWSEQLAVGRGLGRWFYDIYEDGEVNL